MTYSLSRVHSTFDPRSYKLLLPDDNKHQQLSYYISHYVTEQRFMDIGIVLFTWDSKTMSHCQEIRKRLKLTIFIKNDYFSLKDKIQSTF